MGKVEKIKNMFAVMFIAYLSKLFLKYWRYSQRFCSAVYMYDCPQILAAANRQATARRMA